RIGVGHPGVKEMVPIHVLHDFAKADRAWLDPLIAAVADHAALLAEGKDATFANRLHEATGETTGGKKKEKPARDLPASAESAPERRGSPGTEPDAVEGPLARGLRKLFGG
ncbi:MAG: aminoacyl-tRNA hydrolase, partial [Bauldia sp.]|nr:aminoacyl-tRNA hydrolase [Bauldia sp.]